MKNNKNEKPLTMTQYAVNSSVEPTAVNRTYKDTLFRMIFKEKKELLSLYNALNNTDYDDPELLEIVTLENAIYMNMKNDLAFIIDFRLYLYEHQSTDNPNLPIRDLLYFARECEGLLDKKSLYGSKQITIAEPSFFTFYNGRDEMPEYFTQKLSDAYIQKTEHPDLDLTVHVYNINYGHNAELMKRCKTLRDYSIYVTRVREYAKELPIEEAVDKAVNECIKEGTLEEFLRKYRAEAKQMSIFEYDEEETIRIIRQDEREIGWEKGMEAGIQKGLSQGSHNKLRELVQKKLSKGLSIEAITDALEETPETIQTIINEINHNIV